MRGTSGESLRAAHAGSRQPGQRVRLAVTAAAAALLAAAGAAARGPLLGTGIGFRARRRGQFARGERRGAFVGRGCGPAQLARGGRGAAHGHERSERPVRGPDGRLVR